MDASATASPLSIAAEWLVGHTPSSMADAGVLFLKLHVSNLTRNVEVQHLKEIFGKFGRVVSVDLARDSATRLPLGFAVIEFGSQEDAANAQAHLDGGQLDGNMLRVNTVLISRRKSGSDGAPPSSRRSPSPESSRHERGGSRRHERDDRREGPSRYDRDPSNRYEGSAPSRYERDAPHRYEGDSGSRPRDRDGPFRDDDDHHRRADDSDRRYQPRERTRDSEGYGSNRGDGYASSWPRSSMQQREDDHDHGRGDEDRSEHA